MANYCQCGHPQLKHLYGGYGGCNEFKCICDSYIHREEQPLENAVVDDFNSSAASKDGGFLERLG